MAFTMEPRTSAFIDILNKMAETIDINSIPRNYRLASCIVLKGKIISFGNNKMKSHPMQAKFGKNPQSIFLHSEIDAIKNALRHIDVDDLRKSSLYTTRVKVKVGAYEVGNSKPCEGCMRAIATFGIKHVHYINESNEIESIQCH